MEKIIQAFCPDGTSVSCTEFGHGHINSTFRVTTDTGCRYILQRINQNVFKNPPQVMENISAVTEHLQKKDRDPRHVLHFVRTKQGQYWHRSEDGEYWRMYAFVDGCCLEAPETDRDFYESAVAFGTFQEQLSDFPADTLYETIPEFHNTVDRYRQFREAVAENRSGRADTCREEIEYALSLEALGGTLQKMREEGTLPLRVTHNDTKLNNVLLDKETHKGLCILDLDTIMPGLSLYDYGDSIRFGAATCPEDEPDASKMHIDLHLFRVYTRGFLEAAPSLTAKEVEMMPMGAMIMTLEVGIRFLKDYLDGDVYFKTAYPEHNLVRARTQLALVRDMLAHREEMDAIVQEESRSVR